MPVGQRSQLFRHQRGRPERAGDPNVIQTDKIGTRVQKVRTCRSEAVIPANSSVGDCSERVTLLSLTNPRDLRNVA